MITDTSLRAYIHLVGPHHIQARVLAWACELKIARRRTIAYALVYYAHAMAIEKGAGLATGNEYEQLKSWVRQWAGDAAPNASELRYRAGIVKAMRNRMTDQQWM